MRRYALLYPEEVSGVVLVDPMRCEEWPPLNPSKQSQLDLGRRLIRYAQPIAVCGLTRLAVTSLFRRSRRELFRQPAGATVSGGRHVISVALPTKLARCRARCGRWWRRTGRAPASTTGMRSHIDSIPDTVKEMDEAEPIREIPVTVLTPGKSIPLSAEVPLPHWRQCAAGDCPGQRTLDSSGRARSGHRLHSRHGRPPPHGPLQSRSDADLPSPRAPRSCFSAACR